MRMGLEHISVIIHVAVARYSHRSSHSSDHPAEYNGNDPAVLTSVKVIIMPGKWCAADCLSICCLARPF